MTAARPRSPRPRSGSSRMPANWLRAGSGLIRKPDCSRHWWEMLLMNTNQSRAAITAIVDEIERLQRELGEHLVHDDGDREALAIVKRIERKLKSKKVSRETAR